MPEVGEPEVILVSDESGDEAADAAADAAFKARLQATGAWPEDMAVLKARLDRDEAELAAQHERVMKRHSADARAAEADADDMEAAVEKHGVLPGDEDLRAFYGIEPSRKGKRRDPPDSGAATALFKKLNPSLGDRLTGRKNFFSP